MSFLDQLAFGPGRDRRAWARGLMMAIAVLVVAAAVLYFTVSGDYAFLRASVFTGAPTGQYHATGERLAARALKRNGHLAVVATAGSVENIARLVGENGRDAIARQDEVARQMLRPNAALWFTGGA